MIVDIYDMREYVRRELEDLEDFHTLHDLFCTVLRHRGIPYGTLRRGWLRMTGSQLNLFTTRTAPQRRV